MPAGAGGGVMSSTDDLKQSWSQFSISIKTVNKIGTCAVIGQNHRTEETDGVAQLTGPLSSRFYIQILQTLDDVPITNFPVTMVTL